MAARVMRCVLVQRARTRNARKRGGDDVRVTLTVSVAAAQEDQVGILDLDRALERLAAIDERQARVVELCYFGGLTYPEIGELVGVSEATVDRDLRHARAWLKRALSGAVEPAAGLDAAVQGRRNLFRKARYRASCSSG